MCQMVLRKNFNSYLTFHFDHSDSLVVPAFLPARRQPTPTPKKHVEPSRKSRFRFHEPATSLRKVQRFQAKMRGRRVPTSQVCRLHAESNVRSCIGWQLYCKIPASTGFVHFAYLFVIRKQPPGPSLLNFLISTQFDA